MAGVAQLVRALVCGTKGRGFESRRLPQIPKFLRAIMRAPPCGNLLYFTAAYAAPRLAGIYFILPQHMLRPALRESPCPSKDG